MDSHKKAIFRRVIDGQLAEVECSVCERQFRVDRDEDGGATMLPEHNCPVEQILGCTQDCAKERCFDCGACSEHCTCDEGFVFCECERVDVDRDDARHCRAHGPRSTLVKDMRQQEAAAQFNEGSPF